METVIVGLGYMPMPSDRKKANNSVLCDTATEKCLLKVQIKHCLFYSLSLWGNSHPPLSSP